MPESIRVVDWGHFVRLWIAIIWIAGLAAYCAYENDRYFFAVASPREHSLVYTDSLPPCCESYHVDVAQEGSVSWAHWQVFRKMETTVGESDPIVKSHPGWSVLHSPFVDRGFPIRRTHYVVTIVPVLDGLAIQAPDTATYGSLGWMLGVLFLLSGAFVFLVFIWSRAASNVPYVAIVLVLIIAAAHIWITFLQGGLIASPVGAAFTTISAFLVAHAVTAIAPSMTLTRKTVYFLPAASLTIGSMIAHYAAIHRYNEGVMFALQQIHKRQYIWCLFFSFVFGIASLGSRKVEKLKHHIMISSV
jgi:hypothetical protein